MARSLRLEIRHRISGTVGHEFAGGRLLASNGYHVMETDDAGGSWNSVARLPVTSQARIARRVRLLERALRLGCSNISSTPTGALLAVADRQIFRKAVDDTEFRAVHTIQRGKRPLHRGICVTRTGRVCWGEYFSNPERSEVYVYSSEDDGQHFTVGYSFAPGEIRHIHGLQEDPYTGDLWIMTGDEHTEPGLFVSRDDLSSVERVDGGSQRWRTLSLVFTPQNILWGSDSPYEQNFIFRRDRSTGSVTPLQAVGGPIYYSGRNEAGMTFFATTVEPGPAAAGHTEVWVSDDDNRFELLTSFAKDCWPPRLFQFGVLTIPVGTMPGSSLVVSGCGLRGADGAMLVCDVRPIA